VRHNESSGIVNEIRAECTISRDKTESGALVALADVENAIRVAIKVAVDAGDYERATELLDVAKRSTWKPRA
jgi:hypothetical protein